MATVGLWVQTYAGRQIDFFTVISVSRSYGVGTERGRVIGFLQQERPTYRADDSDDVQFRRAGFRYLRITSNGMRRWNVVRTDDFGRIVFTLVDNGFMSKTDDDSQLDFTNVFDFATAFDAGYRIGMKAT